MRAVPVTPRQVMFTVCGQCPSLHAEGLTDRIDFKLCQTEHVNIDTGVKFTLHTYSLDCFSVVFFFLPKQFRGNGIL